MNSPARESILHRGRSRAVVTIVLALSATLPALAGLAQAAPHYLQTAPVDVFDVRVNQTTTADQHEPTLAVDPTNPNNILAASKDWRTGPKQVWVYHSTDAGLTWGDTYPNLMPSELPNQSDPVLAFDASGGAYLAVLGYNQSDLTVGGLFVSASTPGGSTWNKPVLVSANTAKVFNDKEWLTVDRSANAATKGNIYVTWTLFTEVSPTREKAEIVVSRSTDGGKTYSPLKVISDPSQDSVQGSYPVVGPGGELYVLYFNSPAALEEEEQEEQGGEMSSVEADAAGEDALYVVRSTDGGLTFNAPVKVADVVRPPSPLPGSEFRMFVLPTLAVDPAAGTLYALWNDYADANANVMLARSDDGGSSWAAPVRVNDDPASKADQFFPAATVGKDGALHVLWLDRRDDADNLKYSPYYARSTDSGRTFNKNSRLSGALSNPDIGFEGRLIGDYIAIDTSSDGSRVYAVWPDTRNGDQDIYFTSFANGAPPDTLAVQANLPQATAVPLPSPQPLTGFSDQAFIAQWEPADRPVLRGRAQRPWLWGPVSFGAAYEEYLQGAEGLREVQYFDKARMEINNRRSGLVTNGLLVVELIGGRIQIGNQEFAPAKAPSEAPVAGDADSPDAITYASLAGVASLTGNNRAQDKTGQGVTATLSRNGTVTDDPSKAGSVKLVKYETTLGHNIPDVFWEYMNSIGPIYNGRFDSYSEGKVFDWESAMGYPITEPYWTNVKIAGVQKSVLVQAFQRRVLTYVADNPAGWRVEMGNVGRHYFDWRYGPEPK